MDVELIRRLPKTDLHVHLDGSLGIGTLIELARERAVALPSETEEGLRELVFRDSYQHLGEYLEGFRYTVAVLADADAVERVAYELCVDNFDEGVRYVEVRFAPQLHVRRVSRSRMWLAQSTAACDARSPSSTSILRSRPARSPASARRSSSPRCGSSRRSSRTGTAVTSRSCRTPRSRRSTRRRAWRSLGRPSGSSARGSSWLPSTSRAGSTGYPASDHPNAFQAAHEGFLGKTVHAGEDYGPESISQAITVCHTDRIGHGTWLFDPGRVHGPDVEDPDRYVEELAQVVADKRITIEVCLTSNQQTVPELADDGSRHPFGEMNRRRLSTTFCTDNRLVSNTTVSDEIMRGVDAFDLTPSAVRNCLIYGFKRSFFPATYLAKRAYVRQVIDFANRVLAEAGIKR